MINRNLWILMRLSEVLSGLFLIKSFSGATAAPVVVTVLLERHIYRGGVRDNDDTPPCQVSLSTFTLPPSIHSSSLSTCQPIHSLKRLLLSIRPSVSSRLPPVRPGLFPGLLFVWQPARSLFPICLFHHLSPPNSSELAACRELCLTRVNGVAAAVAVNTSQCCCLAP